MDARPAQRRLLLGALAILALASVTSACGGGSSAQLAPKDPPPAQYSSPGLSFSYPAAWTASEPTGPSELHFHPIVYLSTQPVHAPCSTKGNETDCGFPLRQLDPGGILVTWQYPYVLPGFSLGAGAPLKVDARSARRTTSDPGICRSIGADRTIDVLVELSPQSSYLELTACLRGPGLAQAEKSVDALLASTKFTSQ